MGKQMTPEQVSALSDAELNRAMIWLYYLGFDINYNPHISQYVDYTMIIDYLSDYNLTMPLAINNQLTISPMNDPMWPNFWRAQNNKAIGISRYDKSPLRAACECLVLIALADK